MMRIITGIVFLLLASFVEAMTSDDALLLKKEYQLYQAWTLSRNYYFGMTRPRDQVKSLAWQLAYLNHLPHSYPEKEKLLVPYQFNLTAQQRAHAQELADLYTKKYHLGEPFSEADLYRIFELHQKDEIISWEDYHPILPPETVWSDFNRLLKWLVNNQREEQARLLEAKKQSLGQKGAIVFGQILIIGPESPAMVDTSLEPDAEGYFIGQAQDKVVEFSLPGYSTVRIPIDPSKQIQGIGAILLRAAKTSKKTGMVGRVLPWADLEKSNLLLHFYPGILQENKDPWRDPAVNMTVDHSGQFYATGLVPGHYQLVIATLGLKSFKEFFVRENEIRGLSLIDLRKRMPAHS